MTTNKSPRTATYIGGPLDGKQVAKAGGGQWPIYRDDDGQPVPAPKGDREWHRWDRSPGRYYTHQVKFDRSEWIWADVYVHASAWHTYNYPDAKEEVSHDHEQVH